MTATNPSSSDSGSMDHSYIEAHHVVDRYLMNQLPSEEAEQFEEHYLSCQECLDQLELAEAWQRGHKRAVVEDATIATVQQAGLLAWLLHRSPAARAGLVSALLLGIAAPITFLALDLQRTRGQLDEALSPRVGTTLVALSATRSLPTADAEPTHVVRLSQGSQWVVVSLQVGAQGYDAYRVALLRDGTEIWSQDGVSTEARNDLNLTLHSDWLDAGDYLARVEATTASGELVPVARFPFRVVRDD